jgi:hypothetical protein
MPATRLLIIDETADGIYLLHFAADGSECSDTWHETVDDAREQAAFEFERLLGQWKPVPDEAPDLRAFARDVMGQRRSN